MNGSLEHTVDHKGDPLPAANDPVLVLRATLVNENTGYDPYDNPATPEPISDEAD
jgi:hypothetical protein